MTASISLPSRLPLAAVLLAAVLPAQGTEFFFPADAPAQGNCSRVPFGAESADTTHRNQVLQLHVTAAELGNTSRRISELSFAPCGTGTHEYGRLQVRFNHLSGAFTTDLRANIGSGATTVLDATQVAWPHTADTWTPLRLNRHFDYDPARGDLVIEIRIVNGDFQGSTPEFHAQARPCMFANNYSGAAPRTGTAATTAPRFRLDDRVARSTHIGVGCGTGPMSVEVTTGNPRIGQSFALRGTGADPAATSNLGVMWFGFQRLDRELTAIGAPGCTLLCTIEIDFGVAWNNGSTQAVSIPVPNDPALAGGHVFVQVVHADPAANAVGVVLSDALNLAVGL